MHTKTAPKAGLLAPLLALVLSIAHPANAQPPLRNAALQSQRTASAATSDARASSAVAVAARGVSIVVKTPDFETSRQEALRTANRYGAELMAMQARVSDKGRKYGDLHFRLPVPATSGFLTQLRALGTLSGERFSTRNQETEAASLEKRVQRLQQHETRLDTLLAGERRLRGSDILYVQERLFRASVDESLLTQRREDIQRDGQYCRVTLTLFEPVEVTRTAQARRAIGHSFADGLKFASGSASLLTARGLTLLAYVTVFAPLWIGLGLVSFLAFRKGRRWWRRRHVTPA